MDKKAQFPTLPLSKNDYTKADYQDQVLTLV
jgi:hypothetical protein